MRKASILVLALLMIVGTLALVYLEKSAAQAQQQRGDGTKEISIQVEGLSPGDGYSVIRMWRVPSGDLPGVCLRIWST